MKKKLVVTDKDFRLLAQCHYDHITDGDLDLLEDTWKILRKYNLVDENDEWIYPEDQE